MVESPKTEEASAGRTRHAFAPLLAVWLLLAALAQVLYLAHWPLVLFETAIPYPGVVMVALVRLGVYVALAQGVLDRNGTAEAGAVLECYRSFALFAVHMVTRDHLPVSATYPAVWTQGLLAAVLPALWLLNAGVAHGWSPGAMLEVYVRWAAYLLATACVLTGGALLRHRTDEPPGSRPRARWPFIREGLPPALALTAVEGIAWLMAGTRAV